MPRRKELRFELISFATTDPLGILSMYQYPRKRGELRSPFNNPCTSIHTAWIIFGTLRIAALATGDFLGDISYPSKRIGFARIILSDPSRVSTLHTFRVTLGCRGRLHHVDASRIRYGITALREKRVPSTADHSARLSGDPQFQLQ